MSYGITGMDLPITYKKLYVLLLLLGTSWMAIADVLVLRPYILSSNVQGDIVKSSIEVKEALARGGFELIGEYKPDSERHVLVVTNDYLKNVARTDPGAVFTIAQSVTLTRVNDKIQIAYTNPQYYQYAFQVKADLSVVNQQLKEVLGAQASFGARGVSQAKLSAYKYSYGMESFEDFLQLGQYNNHSQALKYVEQNLSASSERLGKVFRVDLPGTATSILGVSIRQGQGSDTAIAAAVDSATLKHTPRLPYSVVVQRGKVFALHPRFKLPLDFPDIERTGDHSFTRIIKAPGAIEATLRLLTQKPE
jgi:hypothetical protein